MKFSLTLKSKISAVFAICLRTATPALVITAGLSLILSTAHAAETAQDKAEQAASNVNVSAPVAAKVEKHIRSQLPEESVLSINRTPVQGIYQVEMNSGELLLVSEDGKYLITGDLLQITTGSSGQFGVINLTESFRGEKRVRLLQNLDTSKLITYQAKNKKLGEVYVFTDTDCGYCRKFHSEIPELTARGVEVNYLAWPRAGVDSSTGQTMVNIWCSKDKLAAMDSAKRGGRVSAPKSGVEACVETVTQDRVLGEQLGVRGTPAIYLKDGRQIGGYLRADQLIEQLDIE